MATSQRIAIAQVQRAIARIGGSVRFNDEKAAIARTDPDKGSVSMTPYDARSVLEALRYAEAHLTGQPYTPLPKNPMFEAVAVLDRLDQTISDAKGLIEPRASGEG